MQKLEKIIEYGFYLFIFLLPWQTRLIWQDAFLNGYVWEYGRFSLYGSQILLWLILFLFVIKLFKSTAGRKLNLKDFWQHLKNPAVFIYWLIIIFVLVAALSACWSLNSSLAYYRWFVLVQAVAALVLVMLSDFKLEKIAAVWVASAGIQSIFAIWQFFAQVVPANKWFGLALHLPTIPGSIILQTQTERWLRAYGSLPHPNILAGFLVIAVLFLLYLAFLAKNRSQRIFVLVSLLAIIPALFFTFSRSAWIAIIVCLLILSGWLYRQKQYLWNKTFLKIFLLTVLMVVILGINLRGPLATRIKGDQDLEVASIQLRMTYTRQAWDLIKEQPWQGTGIGNYTLVVFQKINNNWPGYYYQPVHNIYLLVLAETGIFGAAAFGLILLLLLLFFAKKAGQLDGVIIFLGLLSILIISLFDHYFWTIEFGVLIFWLVLGLNLKRLR